MKFSELKKNVNMHPDGLSHKEELAWYCMSYLNALYRFGKVDKKQVKSELAEIEHHFMRSLSPYEKTVQEVQEGGNALSIAYHLMRAQADKELWKPVMEELLKYADKA